MPEEVYKPQLRPDDQRGRVQLLRQLCVSDRFIAAPEPHKQGPVPLMRLSGLRIYRNGLSELLLGVCPLPIASEQRVRQRNVSFGESVGDIQGLASFGLRFWERFAGRFGAVCSQHVVAIGEAGAKPPSEA